MTSHLTDQPIDYGADSNETKPVKATRAVTLPADDDALVSTDILAVVRDVPASRLEKERLKGEGCPFIKDGHLVRYRVGDYRAWLASQQRFTSTSEAVAA